MAVFSEDFKNRFRDFWEDYDIFFIILGVIAVIIVVSLIICLIADAVTETKADGGLIIDKFISEGCFYLMVCAEKDGEPIYVKVGIKAEEYYNVTIGDIYNKN